MNSYNHEDGKVGIVLSSKILLARNIYSLPFPNKLNYIKGRDNSKKIYNALKGELADEEITLYEIWNTKSDFSKQYLEKDLVSEELLKNSDKGAFILNKEETVSIMINEKDHISLQCITDGLNLEEAFNKASDIDDKIEKNFEYAFDDKLGYLTSSPESVGTGMKASVILHLPAITMSEEIKNISKKLSKNGIAIKSVYLDDTNPCGNLYRVINKISLGLTEASIINKINETVLEIMAEENKFREILINKCKYELEDKIFRAYGTLKYSVLLKFNEALDLISSVRLGAELKFIDIDKDKLDKLFMRISDSAIQNNLGKILDEKESMYERAKFIKEALT